MDNYGKWDSFMHIPFVGKRGQTANAEWGLAQIGIWQPTHFSRRLIVEETYFELIDDGYSRVLAHGNWLNGFHNFPRPYPS